MVKVTQVFLQCTPFSNSQGISCKHTCSFLLPDLDAQTSVTSGTPFPWPPASTSWGGASALLRSGFEMSNHVDCCNMQYPNYLAHFLDDYTPINNDIANLCIYMLRMTCMQYINASQYVYSQEFAGLVLVHTKCCQIKVTITRYS